MFYNLWVWELVWGVSGWQWSNWLSFDAKRVRCFHYFFSTAKIWVFEGSCISYSLCNSLDDFLYIRYNTFDVLCSRFARAIRGQVNFSAFNANGFSAAVGLVWPYCWQLAHWRISRVGRGALKNLFIVRAWFQRNNEHWKRFFVTYFCAWYWRYSMLCGRALFVPIEFLGCT